jgi:hypothetical protein
MDRPRSFARRREIPAADGLRRLLVVLLLLAPMAAQAQSCPAPLGRARRLVLVVADTMTGTTATLRRFERAASDAPWHRAGGPQSALIGHNGIGWARAFRRFAQAGEPIKVEGDKRNPAGFFLIGRSFGFAPSRRPGYLRITQGTVCVDDWRSPAYNTVTSRARVGWRVHGESMWRMPVPAYSFICACPGPPEPRAAWRCRSRNSRPCRISRRVGPCWPFYRGRRLGGSRGVCRSDPHPQAGSASILS